MASTQTTREVNLSGNKDMVAENSARRVNVGPVERWISGIGGGALSIYGIARQDWTGRGLAVLGAALVLRGASGHSIIYQRMQLNRPQEQQLSTNVATIPGGRGIKVRRTVTINRHVADLYAFWHDVEKTPLYTPLVESVTRTGERTSHWVAKSLTGQMLEWNSELLEDRPDSLIAWHVHGKTLTGEAGKVSFKPAPAGRGTEVTLELDYYQNPALVTIGTITGKAAEIQVMETLRRFKNLMEAQEVPTTKDQPSGRKHTGRRQR
ncbi:MAG: hypothetical protein NVS2B12_38450 [Ktedonobacteraceae bacterium]